MAQKAASPWGKTKEAVASKKPSKEDQFLADLLADAAASQEAARAAAIQSPEPSAAGVASRISSIEHVEPRPLSQLRPGDRDTNKTHTSERGTITSQRQIPMEEADVDRMLIAAMGMPHIQEQMRGAEETDRLVALARQHQTPPQLDLSPVLSWIDAQYGTNYSKNYKRPETLEERQQRLLASHVAAQRQKDALAESVAAAMRTQKGGTITDQYQGLIDTQSGTESAPPRPQAQASNRANLGVRMKEVRDTLNKTIDPLEQRYEQLDTLQKALASRSMNQVGATLSIIAKNIGTDSGMLSNQDIGRTMARTIGNDWAKIEAYFTSNPGVQLHPKIVRELEELVVKAMDSAHKRYGSSLTRKVQQFKQSPDYKDYSKDIDAIAAPSFKQVEDIARWNEQVRAAVGKGGKRTKVPTKDEIMKMTPEQRRKFIEENKGKVQQ